MPRKFAIWELSQVDNTKPNEPQNDNDICQCRYCGRLHKPLGSPPWRTEDAEKLAGFIANELAYQGNEIDNLGDCESVVLVSAVPTINLNLLAENIIKWMHQEKS
jgi:hypothetical protein